MFFTGDGGVPRVPIVLRALAAVTSHQGKGSRWQVYQQNHTNTIITFNKYCITLLVTLVKRYFAFKFKINSYVLPKELPIYYHYFSTEHYDEKCY